MIELAVHEIKSANYFKSDEPREFLSSKLTSYTVHILHYQLQIWYTGWEWAGDQT